MNVVNDVGTTPLSDAASLGYFEMVELLLLHGARSDVPTGNALLSAVHCGNARVVGLILDAGADPNAPTEGNETALHAAAASSDAQEVIRVLVEAGANMEARYFDETPLDVALRLGHNQVAQTLHTLRLNSQARL